MMICPVCETEAAVTSDGRFEQHTRVVEQPGWNGPPKPPRACIGSGLLAAASEEGEWSDD